MRDGSHPFVDDTAELAIGQFFCLEPAVVQLDRDPLPDLPVLVPLPAEFRVAAADETVHGLVVVRVDIGDDPDRGRLGQPGGGGQVADQILREGVTGHRLLLPVQLPLYQIPCPKSGTEPSISA
jgi:hypothetical protein